VVRFLTSKIKSVDTLFIGAEINEIKNVPHFKLDDDPKVLLTRKNHFKKNSYKKRPPE
jgi:hypothetical protein